MLERDSIGHGEKKVYMNIYQIMNNYRDIQFYKYKNTVNRNKER
jgi:hypothetical protein